MQALPLVLSVAAALVGLGQAAKVKTEPIPNLPLPDYIGKGCSPTDVNLDECVVRKGAPVVKIVAAGDPKYNIPKMDPLVNKTLRIHKGTRPVGLTMEITNCTLYGLKNTKFFKAKLDLPKSRCELFFELDKLFITGKYNAKGQVLILPILGKGDANFTAVGMKNKYSLEWALDKRANGLDYARVTKYSLTGTVDRLHIHMDNLFNGDKLRGENMNKFMNNNWRELMKYMGPELDKVMGEVFKNTLSGMADLIPIQTIFPAS